VIILGIDPGTHRTGWGVVQRNGNILQHLGHGVIEAEGKKLVGRLHTIGAGLEDVLSRFSPDTVVVEALFHAKNSRSALMLGHARGVALLCVGRVGATLEEYSPAEIKRAVTGNGRADKQQVQQMVCILLGVRQGMSEDASDALAAAICHAHRGSGSLIEKSA